MLDRLPAWACHAILAFFAPAVGLVAKDVIAAGGVTAITWHHELIAALNIGAVSLATAVVVLWATPTTRKYGVGAVT